MIQEGDFAIFKKGDNLKIFQIKSNKPAMIDRSKCNFEKLINQPFGYEYEIVDKHFQRKKPEQEVSKTTLVVEGNDNRNLLDISGNQKLSKDEIEELKNELDGKAIIEKLIENSDTFQQKTEYSKAKYLKKKKEKYLPIYQILRPTARTLAELYMQGRMKRKILNMRLDTISQILTYSNVAAHRNVLVMESCKGVLLASIVERVGGFGNIINLSPNGGDNSTKQSLEHMNFPEAFMKSIHNFPLEKSDKLDEYVKEIENKVEIADNEQYKERQVKKLETTKYVYEILKNKQIDCFVLASKFRPLPILEKLIDYLAPNRWFVIYSQIQEPLIECHKFLKSNRKAIHLEMAESWFREYQVLAERTHPKVMMDCCGGYLLTGITVSRE